MIGDGTLPLIVDFQRCQVGLREWLLARVSPDVSQTELHTVWTLMMQKECWCAFVEQYGKKFYLLSERLAKEVGLNVVV